jgi:hypothetical protein
MTPPSTAAARSAPASRRAAVRHPRRVSGRGQSAATVAAPLVALPSPRVKRRPQQTPGIALRAADALVGVSKSALLDRLIRSRLWIGVLAFSLIGIVAMQLLVLKLNTQVGRVLVREATLQRENALMRIEGSQASSGGLVEPAAAAAGMTVAAPGSLHFVAVGPDDVGRAARALQTPLPSSASLEAGHVGETQPSQAASSTSEAPASPGEASTAEGVRG